MRAARSLLAIEALSEAVRASHGLDAGRCVLLRTLVNDVYEFDAAGGRFVLKVYQHGRWSAEEVAWELELTAHLAREGVGVPDVVPMVDSGGRLVGVLDAPEGPRPHAVFAFDEGDKPRPPFSDELYRDFGRLVAAVHDAGDRYKTELCAAAAELGVVAPANSSNARRRSCLDAPVADAEQRAGGKITL